MSFIYTRSQLKSRMNAGIQGKVGMLIDPNETMNEAVRECFSSGYLDEDGKIYPLDFRSARRQAVLSPNLYNGIFEYSCPSDLDAFKIIDIPAQATRQDGEFFLVPSSEFDIKKEIGSIAIDDYNGTRVLKINSKVNSKTLVASELDSLSSGAADGTNWQAFGDAESLAADNDDYVKGNGSIKFNISAAGGTTAGIQHSNINSIDITDYLGGTSAYFVWHKINLPTNITNYILRFGSDASNYYQKTITARADGTAFVAGYNLLRFDLTGLTTVGSPVNTAIKFYAIYMTKTAEKVSETDYKFDWLVLKRGVIHNVDYYTKYGWQSAAGAYKENSTDDSDLVVADADEFQIVIQKSIEKAARETNEYDIAREAERKFREMARAYMLRNPSEAKIFTSNYYDY